MPPEPILPIRSAPDTVPGRPVEMPPVPQAAGRKARAAAIVTAPVEPLLLAATAAARLCAVSLASWYRLVSAGRTPAPVRLGGSVRWRAEELRAWIAGDCPSRREWEARRAAVNASGWPR